MRKEKTFQFYGKLFFVQTSERGCKAHRHSSNRWKRDRCEFRALLRDGGCINLGHLLVALTRAGHIHLRHYASMPYDAEICCGGIGRCIGNEATTTSQMFFLEQMNCLASVVEIRSGTLVLRAGSDLRDDRSCTRVRHIRTFQAFRTR